MQPIRRKFIAGNWKMHGTRQSVQELLQTLKDKTDVITATEIAVFPPFVYLHEAEQQLAGTSIAWGAQNMSDQLEGAFTGEVSPRMLLEYGCSYVIIGHSERRILFQESNQLIAKKFLCAQELGLKPILCVGESDAQRAAGLTLTIIRQQLAEVLNLVDNFKALSQAVIAYEPIWAIGTGNVATPAQAQEVHAAIRAQIAEYQQQLAEQMLIVYGGSVKANNAADLFSQADIDGALVGGASLNAKEFLEIARQCHS